LGQERYSVASSLCRAAFRAITARKISPAAKPTTTKTPKMIPRMVGKGSAFSPLEWGELEPGDNAVEEVEFHGAVVVALKEVCG
jgi:hypothetical protein